MDFVTYTCDFRLFINSFFILLKFIDEWLMNFQSFWFVFFHSFIGCLFWLLWSSRTMIVIVVAIWSMDMLLFFWFFVLMRMIAVGAMNMLVGGCLLFVLFASLFCWLLILFSLLLLISLWVLTLTFVFVFFILTHIENNQFLNISL